MSEFKRKSERRQLIYYLKVLDKNTNNLIGHLADITPEGLMLLSDQQNKPGKIFNLRILLPEETIGSKYLDVRAMSLWCKNDVNESLYDTGLKFINLSITANEIIESLIDEISMSIVEKVYDEELALVA